LKQISLSQREVIFLFFVFITASVLLFLNLGNIYLWQDEAQTALISQTILTDGIPKGYDGKNFFSQELGAEYGDNYVWKWHTWFPFYLLAAFFKIFGTTTFVARLPFAIFGLGCLFLLYFFSKSLWKDKNIAAMSVAVLLFSIPFLILSRQCRYYSLTAFFSLGGLYGYHAMTQGKRSGPYMYLIASTFLFHTHYVYLATLQCTVALHTLLFHRSYWKKILLWSVMILLINAPWILWLSDMKYGKQYGQSIFSFNLFIFKLRSFLFDLRKYIFPLSLFSIPIWIIIYNWLCGNRILPMRVSIFINGMSLIVFFIIINLISLSIVAPAPLFRYLAPLLPLLAMIIGFFIGWAMRIHFLIGIGVLVFMVFFGPFKDFIYEITHDYNGPIESIVGYLNENAKKTDTVAITYGDLPLKFYTGLRVIGGLTGEDLTAYKDPDWVIIRKHTICEKDSKVRDFLNKQVNWQLYEEIRLSYPDIPFENRESPKYHLYRTKVNVPPVILYHRVE
jgi:4-amino-4-deoxy-L-arabinose transferase-like glycosyltransferase